jgi:hypothetical protein
MNFLFLGLGRFNAVLDTIASKRYKRQESLPEIFGITRTGTRLRKILAALRSRERIGFINLTLRNMPKSNLTVCLVKLLLVMRLREY